MKASEAADPTLVAQLRLGAFTAIQNRDTEKLQAILRKAGDPRPLDVQIATNDYSDTLLEWAIRHVALDAVRLLLESGSDPMQPRGNNGLTTLHMFACNSHAMRETSIRAIVDLLSGAGADFNAKDKEGWTPLHFAIFTGSPTLATVLIEHGVRVDPKLLEDAEMERRIVPPLGEMAHFSAAEALRTVRALALEKSMLEAMRGEGELANQPGMTL